NVTHERDVRALDFLEEEDRIAAPALVLKHERHHVLFDRDGVGDVDHLAGVGAPVRPHEAPEVLVRHARRSYPGSGRLSPAIASSVMMSAARSSPPRPAAAVAVQSCWVRLVSGSATPRRCPSSSIRRKSLRKRSSFI